MLGDPDPNVEKQARFWRIMEECGSGPVSETNTMAWYLLPVSEPLLPVPLISLFPWHCLAWAPSLLVAALGTQWYEGVVLGSGLTTYRCLCYNTQLAGSTESLQGPPPHQTDQPYPLKDVSHPRTSMEQNCLGFTAWRALLVDTQFKGMAVAPKGKGVINFHEGKHEGNGVTYT